MSAPHQSMISMGTAPPPVPLGSFTFASDEIATSIAWPGGHQADDIGILIVVSANETVSTPSGWNVINTPIGIGVAGNARSTAVYGFWRRATSSSEANVSIADSGTMQIAIMNAIRGANLTASPIEAITGDTDGLNPTAVLTTTTLGPNRYVIGVTSGTAQPATTNQANCSWTANGNLASFVELADSAFRGSGLIGASVAAFGGVKTDPGAVGTTSGTLVNNGNREHLIFALKPQF